MKSSEVGKTGTAQLFPSLVVHTSMEKGEKSMAKELSSTCHESRIGSTVFSLTLEMDIYNLNNKSLLQSVPDRFADMLMGIRLAFSSVLLRPSGIFNQHTHVLSFSLEQIGKQTETTLLLWSICWSRRLISPRLPEGCFNSTLTPWTCKWMSNILFLILLILGTIKARRLKVKQPVRVICCSSIWGYPLFVCLLI